MPYSVSSWFVERARAEQPNVRRMLTIGGSDYSRHVIKWPSIARAWNDIRPVSVTISLANDEQTFNFFRDDKTKLRSEAQLRIGFRSKNLWMYTNSLATGGPLNIANQATATASADGSTLVQISSNDDPYVGQFVPTYDGQAVAGKTFTASAEFRGTSTSSGKPISIFMYAYNSVESINFYSSNNITLDPSTWQRQRITAMFSLTTNVNTIHCRFDPVGGNWSSGDTFLIRYPQLEESNFNSAFEAHDSSSYDQFISPFVGRIEKAIFDQGKCDITLTDKLKQLADRVIGTSNAPVTFNNSATPPDIAWYAVTSYGGFSNIRSTSNPDIDYQSWLDWAAVFSADTVYMAGRFDGQRVLEVLRKIGRHTQSAIFLKEDKLAFFRFTTVTTDTTYLDAEQIKSTRLSIEDTDMVNKQWVHAQFVPASDYWVIGCFDVKTASVNSFGLREHVERDEQIWYVNSSSALNLAQRVIRTAGEPYERLEVKTILAPLHRLIGETIQVMDDHLGITEGWRVMRYALDLDTGEISLQIDGTQINTPFILDQTSLDGTEILL